jgi:hypothetical protein
MPSATLGLEVNVPLIGAPNELRQSGSHMHRMWVFAALTGVPGPECSHIACML